MPGARDERKHTHDARRALKLPGDVFGSPLVTCVRKTMGFAQSDRSVVAGHGYTLGVAGWVSTRRSHAAGTARSYRPNR